MRRSYTLFSLLFFCLFSVALTSCKKFEGDQTVPSYIRIDAINLECDYNTYGANTSRFVDAWILVDDDDRGCYELPATIPILKKGPHKITVYAGIAVNGVKDSRADYPFTSPLIYENVNLVPDSIIPFNPTVNYWPDGVKLHMYWKENFDGGTCKMEATDESDVPLSFTTGPMAWQDPLGFNRSGKVTLNSDTAQFFIASTGEFVVNSATVVPDTDIPYGTQYCMLEMDYKCSDTCAVGLIYKLNYTVNQEDLVRLKPTCNPGEEPVEWRKIYINLGPYFYDYRDSDYFRIYLSSWYNRNDGNQSFYFDNLKIIYIK